MQLFRKFARNIKVWAFTKHPRWFGHNIEMTEGEYKEICLENLEDLMNDQYSSAHEIHQIINKMLFDYINPRPRMKADVRAFLEQNNGVVIVKKNIWRRDYGYDRVFFVYHICFLDSADMVAFKLAFM